MKGTQRRGRFDDEDRALAAQLASSPKEQSENIMIVDLVRNDMAKVAQLGTVKVQTLLEVEPYPNVFQLVSEITCRTLPTTELSDVFAALFPSGSVTGAPKASAMSLISSLEDSPRGVYCGAVGLLEPTNDEYSATFNVAIRTAVVTARGGEFGTGGGIVYDSDPAREHAEMVLKAQQLQAPSLHFRLLETFRYVPHASTQVMERHLARLRRSANDLGFLVPEDLSARVQQRLDDVHYEARVRVLVSSNGRLSIQHAPAPASLEARVRLAIDDEHVESHDPFLFHKTTRREVYNRRRRRFPDADDVVMVNERGECTEVTMSNLAIQRDGQWLTPPLASGCLPGIARAMLLERGELIEAVVLVADLEMAEDIAVVNSLRGWRRAELVVPTTSLAAPRRT
jgi:para-aminobenzoate synthetase/4-amino-4-deoxychorismate lyase